jgi:hypothetical protein
MALITKARARQNNALSDTTALPDDELDDLINAASTYIERYCDRKFTSASVTERLDGNDLDHIFLRNTYVTALTSLTITEGDGTNTSIATSNLDFDNSKDGCRVWFVSENSSAYQFFPRGEPQNITVTYTYGYSTIPEDVQEACVQICKEMWGQNVSDRDPSLSGERLGEYQYTVGSGGSGGSGGGGGVLTAHAEQLLATYVRTVF